MLYLAKNWSTLELVKKRLLEITISLFLFMLFVISYDYVQDQRRELAPVTEYFEVRQIAIPDHSQGEDPIIIYDRTVHKPFRGTYNIEIQKAGTLQPLESCIGRNTINYSPEKKLPEDGPTLSWFLGKKCDIPAGSYRIEACWDVYRYRASVVHYCKQSAIFMVHDSANLPAQNQILEPPVTSTQE